MPYRVVSAFALLVALLVFAFLVERAAHYERSLDSRITQLEIHDCGFTQFEDYSVAPQAMDWARERCVDEIRQRP